MAARFKTLTYTIPAGGIAALSTILNSPADTYVSSISLRAKSTNAGNIIWKDSIAGADGGYLDASEAITMDLTTKFVSTTNFFIDGTQDDIVYITVIG